MKISLITSAALVALSLCVAPTFAQGIAFDDLRENGDQPLEVNSDQLQVDQAAGKATFTGDVVISQGNLRLNAAEVVAYYAEGAGEESGSITRLTASGGVVIATGTAGIEAKDAEYDMAKQEIVMTGDVVLTQEGNVISGQRLVIDVAKGVGTMGGRVRTILQTGGNRP